MHELTVATQIREGLEREFGSASSADDAAPMLLVDVVRIRVGALSGIVPEALEFAWPHATADSPLLSGASIQIEFVEVSVDCAACGTPTITPDLNRLRCPLCGSPDVRVDGGNELDIVSVDVREPHDPAPVDP